MRKLLAAPDPAPAVAAMARCGVLTHVLPGADPGALPVLVHLEGGLLPRWPRRLAVLGGKDVQAALRLSREESRILGLIRDEMASTRGAGELGYRFGALVATDAVLARAALMGSTPAEDWRGQVATGAAAKFPLRAADLMPAYTGTALGARLAELEARWIASGFALGRDELLT